MFGRHSTASFVLFLLLVLAPSLAAAQPAAVTNPSASRADSVTFSWTAASGATWYYLWVTDASGAPKHQVWYTAEQVGCASTSTCRIMLTLNLLPGAGTWWVRSWSTAGFGGWTAAQTFTTSGPLSAIVSASGVLVEGTAVSASKTGTGSYQVVFGRDITRCTAVGTLEWIYSIGGTTSAGVITAAPTLGSSPNAVFVHIYAMDGNAADRQFHLNIICS